VYPVEWKYFNPDSDLQDLDNEFIIIDPANPRENLAKAFSRPALIQIRSLAHQAITLLTQKRYNEAFDPGNQVRAFWESHMTRT